MRLGAFDWIMIFLVIGLLCTILYFMIFKKNKYKFRIRLLTGTKRLIIDDLGIEFKDEKKVRYVKLKKMKEVIPMPPSDAIDLNKGGKKIVECYRDECGNYSFIKDTNSVNFFQPIDTEMQVLLADQVVKAHSRTQNWKQYMPMIIGLGFVIVIVLGGMVLIGEPLKAISSFTTGATQPILEAKEIDERILDKLIILEKDIQIIKAQNDIPEIITPPN